MGRWTPPPWWLWMLVQVSAWFFGMVGVVWCTLMLISLYHDTRSWPPDDLLSRVVVAFGWCCLGIGVDGWIILRGTQTRWRGLVGYGVLLLANGALIYTFGRLFE